MGVPLSYFQPNHAKRKIQSKEENINLILQTFLERTAEASIFKYIHLISPH
jgi:hypothetical protein